MFGEAKVRGETKYMIMFLQEQPSIIRLSAQAKGFAVDDAMFLSLCGCIKLTNSCTTNCLSV
jgi:hypothetical protein